MTTEQPNMGAMIGPSKKFLAAAAKKASATPAGKILKKRGWKFVVEMGGDFWEYRDEGVTVTVASLDDDALLRNIDEQVSVNIYTGDDASPSASACFIAPLTSFITDNFFIRR